jgi:hypothetical protein
MLILQMNPNINPARFALNGKAGDGNIRRDPQSVKRMKYWQAFLGNHYTASPLPVLTL